jgi:membrane protein involved in colicin uptake
MSNSNNVVNEDMDMDKIRNSKNKNSKKTLKSNISSNYEGVNADKAKSTQSHREQTGNSALQKKKPMAKNGNDQKGNSADKEIEKRLKTEYEERVKAEAERKAQSILKQAEERSKIEAEKRSKEIAKEAEDRARQEAEKRSKEIAKNLEDFLEEGRRNLDLNGYNANNKLINPFGTGINLWQNYSRMWINFYKETMNNTAKLTKDLGKSMRNGFIKNT